jgi:hypothetical protein
MGFRKSLAVLVALFAGTLTPQSSAQTPGILLEIEKHAVLTEAGLVVIRIHITCGPFVGVEDFQEGHAGGDQSKTGAESETGIDGTVLCDGVERVHTAHLSPLTDAAFKHGPASASASLLVCMLAGEEQMCFSGSTARRIIIVGGQRR